MLYFWTMTCTFVMAEYQRDTAAYSPQRKDSSLHDFGLWFEWVPKQTSRVWNNNNTIPHMLRPHRGEGGDDQRHML
jgi:hypothetical protein